MERVIGIEVYCHDCEQETRYDDEMEAENINYGITHHCAHCGSRNIHRSPFITCDCGTTVYLEGDTQCEGCGAIFNGFGQKLKDPSEWEEDY